MTYAPIWFFFLAIGPPRSSDHRRPTLKICLYMCVCIRIGQWPRQINVSRQDTRILWIRVSTSKFTIYSRVVSKCVLGGFHGFKTSYSFYDTRSFSHLATPTRSYTRSDTIFLLIFVADDSTLACRKTVARLRGLSCHVTCLVTAIRNIVFPLGARPNGYGLRGVKRIGNKSY